MESPWLSEFFEYYNFTGALVAFGGIVLLTKSLKFIAFKVTPLEEMRMINKERDKEKWNKSKYPPVVKANQKVGLWTNVVFFLLMLPFFVTMEPQPVWRVLLDIFIILMFYDFFYYLSHRFWFHGQGKMRQVHAVHHQARNPTYLDAHYVHPLETLVGLALYMGSIAVLAPFLGPYHVVSVILSFVIFTQLNIINHCFVDLDYFPFRTLSWITRKHAVHHENMHKGNYATITLLYDKIFGTLD
jgi:sterol desaturase/sphingolipid hydroxylase (fatty acid hydroxylase superfamily)